MKRIFSIVKGEYVKWIRNPKMIILCCIIVMLQVIVANPFLERANMMGEAVNVLEGFIGICNCAMMIVFLPICFLVLIADFPVMDQNMLFFIHRSGRKTWIVAQLIFLFLADVTIVLVIAVAMNVLLFSKGFFYNGWSNVIIESNQYYPELKETFISQLIPPNIYSHMLPLKAFILSLLHLTMYFYLLGMIMMLFKLSGRRIMGLVWTSIIVVIGASLVYLQVDYMWFFPAAHGIVAAHYTEFYREMQFPLYGSYIYNAVCVFLLGNLILYKGKNMDFGKFIEI